MAAVAGEVFSETEDRLGTPGGRSLSDQGEGGRPNVGNVTLTQRMLSACSGSLVTSLLVTPLDVVKTRLQAQPVHGVVNESYTGPTKVAIPYTQARIQRTRPRPPHLSKDKPALSRARFRTPVQEMTHRLRPCARSMQIRRKCKPDKQKSNLSNRIFRSIYNSSKTT